MLLPTQKQLAAPGKSLGHNGDAPYLMSLTHNPLHPTITSRRRQYLHDTKNCEEAKWMLQYSGRSNWCWDVPQDHPASSPLPLPTCKGWVPLIPFYKGGNAEPGRWHHLPTAHSWAQRQDSTWISAQHQSLASHSYPHALLETRRTKNPNSQCR